MAANPTPRLAEAYAIKLDAQLRLTDEQKAFATAREMLDYAPFLATVRDAAGEAINYMQLLFTSDAVALAQRRQPKLLDQISRMNSASTDATENVNAAAATLPDLFAQALVLPELQQLAGDLPAAASSIKALDAAVPSSVTSDEDIEMAGWRRRYAQLGKPLGTLDLQRTLTVPARMPEIPAQRAITALLLFPDWCAQCVRMATQIPESVFSVEKHEAYMYGLLVETVAPAKKNVTAAQRGAAAEESAYEPADAAADLKGTSSIVVGAATLTRFNAVEVPLLIVTDRSGVVRFVSPVDETALKPGNTVDSAVARVGAQWPGMQWPGKELVVPAALLPSTTNASANPQSR